MSDIARKRQRATALPSNGYTRRRKAIINAATDVFHSKGLAKTSVLDISDRLGVDRASVYYYFKSKHELFRAVIFQSIDRLVSEILTISERPAPERGKVVEIITRVTRAFADDYPTLHVYIQEDMRRLPRDEVGATDEEAEQLAGLAETYMSTLESLVAKGMASGEFRNVGDPHVVALVIQGAVNWMHRWFTPLEGPSADEVAQILVEILMDGLAVRRPGQETPAG